MAQCQYEKAWHSTVMRKDVAAPIRGIMAHNQFEEVLDSTDMRKHGTVPI